jgi:mono/diheme cytochrome c family protein
MRKLLGTMVLAGLAVSFGTVVQADDGGGDHEGRGGQGSPARGGGGGGGSGKGDPASGGALWAANCAACHGADGSGGSGGPGVRGASAGRILQAVREGEDRMPRFPGIGKRDARNISAYLNGGAPAPDPTPVPDPTPTPAPTPTPTPAPSQPPAATVTWSGQIQAMLSQNCALCHSGRKASVGVRLDTYANASANASRVLSSIEAGRMPPAGKLPASQIQALRDWIAGGRPQ